MAFKKVLTKPYWVLFTISSEYSEWSNHMDRTKNLIAISTSLLLASLFYSAQASSGIYFDAVAGISDHHISSSDIKSKAMTQVLSSSYDGIKVVDKDSDRFSYRIAVGYALTEMIGVEVGYSCLNETDFKVEELEYVNGGMKHSIEASRSAYDIVGKASLPLLFDIFAFAKGGYALVDQKLHNPDHVPIKTQLKSDAWRPTFTLGIDLPFLPFISTQAVYTRILDGGNLKDSIDFVGIGATLHFG